MAVAVEAGERMNHFRWVARDRALAALDDAHTRAGERKMERNAARYLVEMAR